MGNEDVVLIAILVVFLAIIVAIIATVAVVIRKKAQKNAPEIQTKAKVLRLFTKIKYMNENYTSETVDMTGGNEVKTYYVEFLLENRQKIIFPVKRKLFLSYHDNDKGVLVYKGGKMISFTIQP